MDNKKLPLSIWSVQKAKLFHLVRVVTENVLAFLGGVLSIFVTAAAPWNAFKQMCSVQLLDLSVYYPFSLSFIHKGNVNNNK